MQVNTAEWLPADEWAYADIIEHELFHLRSESVKLWNEASRLEGVLEEAQRWLRHDEARDIVESIMGEDARQYIHDKEDEAINARYAALDVDASIGKLEADSAKARAAGLLEFPGHEFFNESSSEDDESGEEGETDSESGEEEAGDSEGDEPGSDA